MGFSWNRYSAFLGLPIYDCRPVNGFPSPSRLDSLARRERGFTGKYFPDGSIVRYAGGSLFRTDKSWVATNLLLRRFRVPRRCSCPGRFLELPKRAPSLGGVFCLAGNHSSPPDVPGASRHRFGVAVPEALHEVSWCPLLGIGDRSSVCVAPGPLFRRPIAHGPQLYFARLRGGQCARTSRAPVRLALSRDYRRHAGIPRTVD